MVLSSVSLFCWLRIQEGQAGQATQWEGSCWVSYTLPGGTHLHRWRRAICGEPFHLNSEWLRLRGRPCLFPVSQSSQSAMPVRCQAAGEGKGGDTPDWAVRSSAQQRLSSAGIMLVSKWPAAWEAETPQLSLLCTLSYLRRTPGLWLTDPQADWVFLKKELEPHTDRQRLLGLLMCVNYCAFC